MRSCGWSSLLDQPEQVETSQNSNTGLAIGGHASIDDDELAQDLTKLSLCPGTSSTSPPVEFGTAFTPYTTTLRAATWNCQQFRFIFDEKRMDSVAHFLSSSSFDLVFLQGIPSGESGQYRLR